MIKLSNVSKTFTVGTEKIHALKGIDLHIQKGEFLAIVGPSGSGKSTLLHLIGGLDNPTDGMIEVNGENIGTMKDRKLSEYRSRQVGFIFQDFKLQPHLTVLENVRMPQLFSRRKKKQSSHKMLESVGLKDREKHKPTEISGGQKQRAAIARALMNNPKLIIADEPTGNLDSMTGKKIIDLLKTIHQKNSVTLIIVTHDRNIAKHATRIIEIKDGKLKKRNNFSKFMT